MEEQAPVKEEVSKNTEIKESPPPQPIQEESVQITSPLENAEQTVKKWDSDKKLQLKIESLKGKLNEKVIPDRH